MKHFSEPKGLPLARDVDSDGASTRADRRWHSLRWLQTGEWLSCCGLKLCPSDGGQLLILPSSFIISSNELGSRSPLSSDQVRKARPICFKLLTPLIR